MARLQRLAMLRDGRVLRHNPAVRQVYVISQLTPEQNQQSAEVVARHLTAAQTEKLQMLLNYYIYYRVAPSAAPRARAVVDAVQSALGQDTGIQGRLLRRDDDPTTWMEIYEAVADSPRFEAALERLLVQHGFDGCLASDSRRHIERFTLF